MEWYVVLIVGLTLLLGLFLSGAPIFIAFMIINVAGTLVYFGPAGFGMFANSLYDTTTYPDRGAPVHPGEFLFRSGAMDVLYDSLDKLVGRSRLRLYYLSIALSTMFGALSGAAMGVVAMLGRSLFPGLIARGYDRGISTGTILAGASLAPIIPPASTSVIIGSPGAGVDRQAADRGDRPGADPGRPVPRLHHDPGETRPQPGAGGGRRHRRRHLAGPRYRGAQDDPLHHHHPGRARDHHGGDRDAGGIRRHRGSGHAHRGQDHGR